MALYFMLLMGGGALGAPILGWVGEALGPRWTLIGGGALTALGVLLSAAVVVRRRQRRGDYSESSSASVPESGA
jgi:hypothetical protein